jgi:NADH-quinone oxidoreductase subunit M
MMVAILATINSLKAFAQVFLLTEGGPELSTAILGYYIYEQAFKAFQVGYALPLARRLAERLRPAPGRWAVDVTVVYCLGLILTAATLFMCVSFLEQRAGGLRGLDDFGGLRKVAPVLCGLMGIALFSSLGLPGLNGFVGEFLIFKGVFPLAPWAAAASVLGLLVTAIFILTILQRVFNGPLNEKWSRLPDLTLAERARVAAPIALMFVLGVWPQLVLGVISPTVVRMVEELKF